MWLESPVDQYSDGHGDKECDEPSSFPSDRLKHPTNDSHQQADREHHAWSDAPNAHKTTHPTSQRQIPRCSKGNEILNNRADEPTSWTNHQSSEVCPSKWSLSLWRGTSKSKPDPAVGGSASDGADRRQIPGFEVVRPHDHSGHNPTILPQGAVPPTPWQANELRRNRHWNTGHWAA